MYLTLFDGEVQAAAEKKAAAIGWLKLYDSLNLMTTIVSPILFVLALGLVVWALVGRLYGKTVDGERQKMSKNHFVGIIVTAIVLIVLASVLVTVMKAMVLADANGIPKWAGYDNYEALKTAANAK